MKIEFEDKSWLEIKKENDKIVIAIQAKDFNNQFKKITNMVEISMEEFFNLVKEIK